MLLNGHSISRDSEIYNGTMMLNGVSNKLSTPSGIIFRLNFPNDIHGMCGGGIFDSRSGQLLGITCAASTNGLRFIEWNLLNSAFKKIVTTPITTQGFAPASDLPREPGSTQ